MYLNSIYLCFSVDKWGYNQLSDIFIVLQFPDNVHGDEFFIIREIIKMNFLCCLYKFFVHAFVSLSHYILVNISSSWLKSLLLPNMLRL